MLSSLSGENTVVLNKDLLSLHDSNVQLQTINTEKAGSMDTVESEGRCRMKRFWRQALPMFFGFGCILEVGLESSTIFSWLRGWGELRYPPAQKNAFQVLFGFPSQRNYIILFITKLLELTIRGQCCTTDQSRDISQNNWYQQWRLSG